MLWLVFVKCEVKVNSMEVSGILGQGITENANEEFDVVNHCILKKR